MSIDPLLIITDLNGWLLQPVANDRAINRRGIWLTLVAVVRDFPQVNKMGSNGDIVDLVWVPYLDFDALAERREELGEDHLLVPDGFITAFLDRSLPLKWHRWNTYLRWRPSWSGLVLTYLRLTFCFLPNLNNFGSIQVCCHFFTFRLEIFSSLAALTHLPAVKGLQSLWIVFLPAPQTLQLLSHKGWPGA